MANNLRKFANEAEYSAATLNYPAVSWVVSGDTVHYDKTGIIDKVMIAFHSQDAGMDIVLFNCGTSDAATYLTSITINDVEVQDPQNTCQLDGESQADTDYIIKYGIDEEYDTFGDIFAGDLAIGGSSTAVSIDFLVPSFIANISDIPSNTVNFVVLAETPPSASWDNSGFYGTIYVPDSAVNTYKAASTWSDEDIQPISDYSGNLPI